MIRRSGRSLATLAIGLTTVAVAAALTVGAPARAAGPAISIEPAGPLADVDQTVTVIGTGFDATVNGGIGIYVVFGPLAEAPAYYTEADRYGAARWVHPGAASTPGQAPMAADGSFTTTLDLRPRYTDGQDRAIDCAATTCHIITMAAHGSADRSQDTFTALAFAAGVSSPVAPGGIVPADIVPWIALLLAAGAAIVAIVAFRHRDARSAGLAASAGAPADEPRP